MAFPSRTTKTIPTAHAAAETASSRESESKIPNSLKCSITGEIMLDPVIAVDGKAYERRAIETSSSPLKRTLFPSAILQQTIKGHVGKYKFAQMQKTNLVDTSVTGSSTLPSPESPENTSQHLTCSDDYVSKREVEPTIDSQHEKIINAINNGNVPLLRDLLSQISVLNLRDKNITDFGAIILAEALKTNTSILVIDLNNNPIHDDGAMALAEVLTKNTAIQEMNLSFNRIGAEGTIALAKAIRANKTLKKFDFQINPISFDGAEALVEILKSRCVNNCQLNIEDKDEGGEIVRLPSEIEVLQQNLLFAIERGNLTAVLILQEKGADILREVDARLETALHKAVRSGNIALLRHVLQYPLNRAYKNENGQTALDLALELHRFDMCELLENVAPQMIIKSAQCPMQQPPTTNNSDVRASSTVTTAAADNLSESQKMENILRAIKENRIALLEQLLSKIKILNLNQWKISVDELVTLFQAIKNNRTITVLHLGQRELQLTDVALTKIIEALQLNRNITTLEFDEGCDVLGSDAVINAILEKNSTITAVFGRDSYYRHRLYNISVRNNELNAQILLYAIEKEPLAEVKKFLEECHVNVAEARSSYPGRETALHKAVRSGNIEMLRYVMSFPVNPLSRNLADQTALDLAISLGRKEMCRLLEPLVPEIYRTNSPAQSSAKPRDDITASSTAPVKMISASRSQMRDIVDALKCGAKYLLPCILEQINILDLGEKKLSVEDFDTLLEALKKNRTITSINFGDNLVNIDEILKCLRKLRAPERIITINKTLIFDFAKNTIIRKSFSYVKSSRQPNDETDKELLAIAEEFRMRYSPCHEDLCLAQVTGINIDALIDNLQAFEVKTLNLRGAGINDADIIKLAQFLKNNRSITELHLENNPYGDEGIAVLAEILKTNTTIKKIYLGNTNISDKGIKALAEMLKVNKTIDVFHISHLVEMTTAGIHFLVEALKVNHTVTKIDFWGNPIDQAGFEELINMLKNNYSIREFILFSDEATRFIRKYLVRNLQLVGDLRFAIEIGDTLAQQKLQALGVKTFDADEIEKKPFAIAKPAATNFKTGLYEEVRRIEIDSDQAVQPIDENKLEIPPSLKCPLTLQLFVDPVITADGQTYEHSEILKWFASKDTSPATNTVLTNKNLINNFAIKQIVTDWKEKNLGKKIFPLKKLFRNDAFRVVVFMSDERARNEILDWIKYTPLFLQEVIDDGKTLIQILADANLFDSIILCSKVAPATEGDTERYNYALLTLAQNRKWELFVELLESIKINISHQFSINGLSALHLAVLDNKVDLIKKYITAKDINMQLDQESPTLLILAAQVPGVSLATFQAILEIPGLDLNKTQNGEGAFYYAVLHNQFDKAVLLLEKNPYFNFNRIIRDGKTAFLLAADCLNWNFVLTYLEKIEFSEKNLAQYNYVLSAAINYQQFKIVDAISKLIKIQDYSFKSESGYDFLQYLISNNSVSLIEKNLDKFDINAQPNPTLPTALIYAARETKVTFETFRFLLQKFPAILINKSQNGKNAVFYAISSGQYDKAFLLLQKDGYVVIDDLQIIMNGKPTIQNAADKNNWDFILACLKALPKVITSDPKIAQDYSYALYIAASRGEWQVVNSLLEYGVSDQMAVSELKGKYLEEKSKLSKVQFDKCVLNLKEEAARICIREIPKKTKLEAKNVLDRVEKEKIATLKDLALVLNNTENLKNIGIFHDFITQNLAHDPVAPRVLSAAAGNVSCGFY